MNLKRLAKRALATLSLSMLCLIAFAQGHQISGTVIDGTGEPIIGANVVIVGGTKGVITDLDGKYSIQVPENGAVLKFSYIGFKTKSYNVAKGKSVLDVTLEEDAVMLEQTVVTAMDLRRDEKSLSTAFQKMDVTSMTENRDAGFVNMLQGKVAGLQVISNGAAGSATVRIRGANSISGNNQPLYVIDGVPIINNVKDGEIDYGNPANNINSDDIESIVVLKGANASALYGSDAANGAILITTKKAGNRSGLGISYSTNVQFTEFSQYPIYQNIYGSGHINQFENNKANTFANFLGPINAQIGNISYVICAIIGGVLALGKVGGFTLGGLASFLTFNKSFSMPINQISMQMNAIVMAMAGADRIFKLMDEKEELDEGYVTLVNAKEEDGKLTECEERTERWAWKHTHQNDGSVDYVEVKGEVVFNGVDFGYNDEKIVLHDIKLYAKPGQKIAFVGSTGAGKTTITNLINRFYDIQDGKIRYDGININKIKKADLRHSLGIVLQDTHLFTGTVRDNIRFGKLDATDEEIVAAAKLANADSFIRRLPKGYDTMLTGDGANLSQGQRQLLAIARAAIADPPVLILDEATSSIDTRTERIVQDGMDKLMRGRTTFVIAHRLSTVRNSDCIMVLEQGRIIERGTHDELIEEKGRYYQLYTGNAISA